MNFLSARSIFKFSSTFIHIGTRDNPGFKQTKGGGIWVRDIKACVEREPS